MSSRWRIFGAVLAVTLLPGCVVISRPYGIYRVWVDKNLYRELSLQCESIERLPLQHSRVRITASNYNTGAPPGFDWTANSTPCPADFPTPHSVGDPQSPAGNIPLPVSPEYPLNSPPAQGTTPEVIRGMDLPRTEGPTALRPISAVQIQRIPAPLPRGPVSNAMTTGGWLFTR